MFFSLVLYFLSQYIEERKKKLQEDFGIRFE